jgi:IPT/TIG domain-containing protein
MRRLLVFVGVVAAALFVAPALAGAQGYGPSPTLELSTSSVAGGGSVTVTGTGFNSGDSGDVVLHSDPVTLGTVTADGNGSFTATFQVPCDPGSHTVTATVGSLSASAGLTITACGGSSAAAGSAQPLAFTGSDNTGLWVGIGALLVLVGAVLTVFTIRRRHSSISA